MDITENLSIDASSILMNFNSEDDFFNPINSSMNENDDFEELMKHIENTDGFMDSNSDLLALSKPEDTLANDIQEFNNVLDSTMDYLNKTDNSNQFNGLNSQNLMVNQQHSSNQVIQQSNEVSKLSFYV